MTETKNSKTAEAGAIVRDGDAYRVPSAFLAALAGSTLTARELRVIVYCMTHGGYDNDFMRLCQHTALFPHHAKSTTVRLIKARILVPNGDRYALNMATDAWDLDTLKASRSA